MESKNINADLDTVRLNNIDEIINLIKDPKLFQSKEWIMAIREGLKHHPFALLTKYKDRKIQLNIFWERNYFLFIKIAASPMPGSFTPYIDPIYFEELDSSFKQRILNHQYAFLKKNGFNYIIHTMSHDGIYKKCLCLNFLNYDTKSSYIIKISNKKETMWNHISSRARNSIRKSKQHNVKITEMDINNKNINLFYTMLKNTFLKRGTLPIHSINFFKSIANYLHKTKLLILKAEINSEIISIGWFIFDNREVHYLSGASTQKGNQLNANNLIQWEIIKYAIQNQISIYDMGGKGNILAINKFKESFKPDMTKYFQVSYKSFFVKIIESLYYFLRSFAGRVNKIIRII